MFMPNISWQKTDLDDILLGTTALAEGSTLNSIVNNYGSSTSGYNLSGNLIYMHRFEKQGRTISLGTGIQSNESTGTDNLDNLTIYESQPMPNDTILQYGNQYSKGGYL